MVMAVNGEISSVASVVERLVTRLPYRTGSSNEDAVRDDLVRQTLRSLSSAKDGTTPVRELAIVALSNLLSANIDVGLKHSLKIGYHEDLEIRTAFVSVLCNVLAQGAEFNDLSDIASREHYDELVDNLIENMDFVIALCDACPGTDVDELTMSLLNIFDSRGLGFILLEALIKHEVEDTENEAELLRRNSVTTKMLSVYARWKGAAYLKSTLQTVIERLVDSVEDLDLELDPSRTGSPEELERNAIQLRVVTKAFLDDITNSSANIPPSFRKICSIIASTVTQRYPDAKFTAVGAFIFLRFFCPAIVAPDAEGLTNHTLSKEMRRGLLLIAKVIQNLANNVLFGAKEAYMVSLNDFLVKNITSCTTFLIEISAPPGAEAPAAENELYDFGSCVALHSFLFGNWDLVRQKLVAQQRKAALRSPEALAQKSPILETLPALIANLGPPLTNISWIRPSITANSPPSYSRFQDFMLRNAKRNAESETSSRAVYDGGESKDGIPLICIVLRHIDAETNDFDLVIYCYLKLASRLWDKPFSILIDSTCYTGQNEPQDALFRQLDLLTPAEILKNLQRVYVYNMNSSFRKCFRRIIRLSIKSDNSVFHPQKVKYHMIGNFQELQGHFHMSQLHLPMDTISVVMDTKFVFQPIIRLSKTKGKIPVAIQVGHEFVQITTVKTQEIIPGLRLQATLNDIFRISDIDEAPTSIQTEDDSAFGLRTENGKIVMYFSSSRKAEILQAIRGAKKEQPKDSKPAPLFERSIRPQDVPGTLLNISLTNISSSDENLRNAAYNLMYSLSKTFNFSLVSNLFVVKDLAIPPDASQFVLNLSRRLASTEPQITAGFINEFFVGWDNILPSQRILNLAYLAPWLPGLRTEVLAAETDGEKGREKVATVIRKLIEVASDPALYLMMEHTIWPVICEDDVQTEIFLDELLRSATSLTPETDESLCSLFRVVNSIKTVSVRGKVISKLRKAINRTSLRPTRALPENSVWGEISVLLRLWLSLSFSAGTQALLYFPETSHIITMLANTGPQEIRQAVHSLLINTVHALSTCFPLSENALFQLRLMLSSLSGTNAADAEVEHTISRSTVLLPNGSNHPTKVLASVEALATLLLEVAVVAAPSVDIGNAWRSRWMGLVASTAFQSNPAIQPRAFTVMGCLAREDVDDDLLYQVLVALRNSIHRFVSDNDADMLTSIVKSLTKMMENLPTTSRYGLQLFWLAMALVRLMPLGLFACAASFLEAVLLNINTSGDLREGRMIPALLQGRQSLEETALLLDAAYGIKFTNDNFHFAVCASLVKGLTDASTRATTLRVLSTFLQVTSWNTPGGRSYPKDLSCLPYLVAIMSRAVAAEEADAALLVAGVLDDRNTFPLENLLKIIDLGILKDKEILLCAAISLMDFPYLDNRIQSRGLRWLDEVSTNRPTVILHLCGPILSVLDDVLQSSQNALTLESARLLLKNLTTNHVPSDSVDTTHLLVEVLEDIGFGGLWRSSTFKTSVERDKRCPLLTEKLVELIIS